MATNDVAVWHNDGHVMCLRLEHQNIIITEVICPEVDSCTHEDTECMVRYFLNRFGLECNVGSCDAATQVEIAWHFSGDKRDLESGQVWVIPTSDDAFAAWVASFNT